MNAYIALLRQHAEGRNQEVHIFKTYFMSELQRCSGGNYDQVQRHTRRVSCLLYASDRHCPLLSLYTSITNSSNSSKQYTLVAICAYGNKNRLEYYARSYSSAQSTTGTRTFTGI